MNQPTKYLIVIAATVGAVTAMGLATSLSETVDYEVTCAGSAGTPVDVRLADGSTVPLPMDSVYLANDSATCVRVGGRAVGSTDGASIGSGCRDGAGISIDAHKAWCISSDVGTVTIDALSGKQ